MTSINRLQSGVCSSLRSSIILFDLPRVVEELTYNSVDAGATKVYVSLNVKTCYIKVEDDGCGITRDDLVILGERYATSKVHLLAGTQTKGEHFGFRGEALASLSDVSLLEIRTKARGMPNAYYKIVKGSNCLFFGMDDEREAVGTTVIVRDLFCNQPVRRNYMQSSPKRVLHSIKKCVLRIALIHPQVSFRVIDCASEDELLFTVPSPSPLSLVSDGFGSEVSSSLREVAFSDHGWILSGYIAGCTNTFSTKGFQYLYINSRFVAKGPIHNLLNSLAANFQCSLAHYMVEPEFRSGKKHKVEGYPAFLLNLHCPVTSYDLHFEPSKTVAEFKDWNAVLSFCGQATKHFWEQIPSKPLEGNTLAHTDGLPTGSAIKDAGISKRSKMKRAECSIQLDHNDFSYSPVTSLLDISLEDTDVYDKQVTVPKYMHTFSLLKPCQRKARYLDQASYSSEHVIHESLDTCGSIAQISSTYGIEQWIGNTDYSLLENNIFPDQTPKLEDRHDVRDRKWKNSLSKDLGNLDKGADCSFLNSDPFSITDNDDNFQFLVPRCSSHKQMENKNSQSVENEQRYSALHTNYSSFSVGLDCLRDGSFYANNHSTKTAHLNGCLVTGTLSMETDNISSPSLDAIRKCRLTPDFDGPSHHLVNPFSSDERSADGKDSLPDRLASEFWVTNSKCRSPEMDWHLDSHQRSPAKRLRTVHDYTQESTSRTHLLSVTSAGCRMNFDEAEEDTEILNSVQNSSNEVCPVKCSMHEFDIQDCCSPKRHMLRRSPLNQNAFVKARPSALSNDELGWSPLNSLNMKSAEAFSKYAFHNSMQDLHDENESFPCKMEHKNSRASDVHRVRSRRSCSAPPFYKGKSRFPTLNNPVTKMTGKDSTFELYFSETAPENICSLDGLSQLCFASQSCRKPNINVSQPIFRKCINEKMTTHVVQGIQSIKGFDNVCSNQSSHKNAAEFKLDDALTMPSKWRTGIPQPTERDVSHKNNDDVLNISSGILHLTGSSLVPESISKDCLDDARVLLQLDRKFIPVMAGNILVIIDQHAADERIRLEELREKVLSGKGKTVSYLDSELELVLPEMGNQLLQKYGDQIQKWGWVCNIRSQCSESFAKSVNLLKRHRSGVTLIAVPCILGINLNDKDLVEFIEQLVETDGSSTIPPSVLRILNFKACRGAIMFGDSLLPSECSLIVEELKATSLCFQCAHGRPTTVPLVNVASLREQLVNLEMKKGAREERWHGLCTHAPSIERAQQRLVSAKRFQGG